MQKIILTQVKDYVQSLLSELETSGKNTTMVDNGNDTYTLTVTTTKNLSEYDHLDFSGDANWAGTYQIKNITDTTFDIIRNSGVATATGLDFIKKIYFFYGTPTNDLKQIINTQQQSNVIANLVVLFMPITSTFYRDRNYLKEADIWLCFMKSYPIPEKWTNDEHYQNAINPMTFLANEFMLLNDYEQNFMLTEHIKYGKLNKFKGYYSELLQQVSGVELENATIKIPKNFTNC